MKKILYSLTLAIACIASMVAPLTASAFPTPTKTFIHPSDQVLWQQAVGYDRVILPGVNGAAQSAWLPVEQDAYNQSTLGPNVMLWIGGKQAGAIARFTSLIDEAKKYPNIKSVYIYDEFCWEGTSITFPCANQDLVFGAAAEAKGKGYESVMIILPQVALHPGFTFSAADLNKFSEIGIDIYPGLLLDTNTYGCYRGANIVEDFLMCSIERLRTLGYTGKINYVYQAFYNHLRTDPQNMADAAMQRLVLDNAKLGKYDISGVTPWGLYLGATEKAAEPWLQPLGGTPLEYYVTP